MSKNKEKRNQKVKPTSSPWAEVRESETHGRGMFATKDIPKDMEIIEYVGKWMTKEVSDKKGVELAAEAKKTGGAAVYTFVINDEFDLDGDFDFNTARLVNHSCAPNCEAQIDDDERIWLIALQDIKKGTELSFNYGFDLEDYENHPCRCGSKKCVGFIAAEEYWPKLKKLEKKKRKKAEKKAEKEKRKAEKAERKEKKRKEKKLKKEDKEKVDEPVEPAPVKKRSAKSGKKVAAKEAAAAKKTATKKAAAKKGATKKTAAKKVAERSQ